MGAANYRETGGGPATGLANDFVKFLQAGLMGTFGGGAAGAQYNAADPYGSTMGVAGTLNSLLSGEFGGAQRDLLSRQTERDAMALRERYGMGGTGYGTPAGFAEAVLRSETAPKMAAIGQQGQLAALQQLLPIFMNLSGKGIAQREGFLQPPAWQSIASIAAPIIGGGLSMMANPFNALPAAASAVAGATGGASPSIANSVGWNEFWPGATQFTIPQLRF